MSSYQPVSGVVGGVTINSTPLSADSWTASFNANIIEAPSFTAGGFMEYTVGMKRGRFSMAGTWDAAYNPFSHSIKIGQTIAFTAFISNTIGANDSVALVEQWDVQDHADGKVDYACTIICNWQFNDFAGTLA